MINTLLLESREESGHGRRDRSRYIDHPQFRRWKPHKERLTAEQHRSAFTGRAVGCPAFFLVWINHGADEDRADVLTKARIKPRIIFGVIYSCQLWSATTSELLAGFLVFALKRVLEQ